ncbi:MAG: nucleotide pyrophosphatase, partial [Gammaproteobacteria bacterium]|nr:nucleotide pyrophosphatase [Gammaproteobacteria bacterium]
RIRDAYEAGGVADRTLTGLAGDHGLTPAFHLLNPEVEVFDALRAEGVDFRVEKISSDEGEGPKLNHPIDPPSMKGIDVVVASTAGGNYMLDLFSDQGPGWAEQPLAADLVALAPLASSGDPAAPRVDIIGEIYTRLRETLDYLVVREQPCGVDGGQVHLIGEREGQRADAWITRRNTRIHYHYVGGDLLGIDRLSPYRIMRPVDQASHKALHQRCVEDAREDDPASWCDETDWRELSSYTERPDSVVQLAHLYDHPRAGTINLFPRAGVGYNSLVPGRHAGETFHEKDAFVGLFGAPLAGPRGRPRLRTAVIGSVPIAIYEYLTGTAVTPGTDGWGYPSLRSTLFRP